MWPLRRRAMWCYSGLLCQVVVRPLFFCDGDFECRVVVRDSLQLRREPCEALRNFTCSHGREEGESETKPKICSVVLIWLDDKMTRRMRCVIFKRGQGAATCWPPESPDAPLVAKDALYSVPPLIFYLLRVSPANQPHSKVCVHAYLFPFPVSHHTHNATEYESAISKFLTFSSHTGLGSGRSWQRWLTFPLCAVYRGFWSVFMLIGVVAVVLAGFIIICAAPFSSHCLYKTGGSLFLASGEAFEICWTCTVYIFPLLVSKHRFWRAVTG